ASAEALASGWSSSDSRCRPARAARHWTAPDEDCTRRWRAGSPRGRRWGAAWVVLLGYGAGRLCPIGVRGQHRAVIDQQPVGKRQVDPRWQLGRAGEVLVE